MAKKILVAVAWPYANGDLHVGHLAGAYLPADIFARYHRLVGNDVLMVSGSDSHGTPITVKADKEGVTPREIFERYHARFLATQKTIGISYDLFTHTDTLNHHRVSQDMFLRLLEQGCLHLEKQQQFFSETLQRFLPDRYVEGTCPHCGYPDARGDQCDNCGRLLDALELGKENMHLNGLETPAEWVEGDVFQVLRKYRDQARTFDLIVLDPPKFAPTAAQVERAARGYKDINLLAFKLLSPGGLLVTFSCSGGVSADLFRKIVAGAALDAGVNAVVLERLSQGEDHPVALTFPEGEYLKGLVLRVN